jgi:putative transposase
MRYAFVAEHRSRFSVRTMCRCLRIHPSGFYAWLKNPLSKRAKEDARQTELIRKAWDDRAGPGFSDGRLSGFSA